MSYDDPLIDTMAAGPGPPSLRQLKRPPSPEPTPHRSRASTCNKTIFTTLTAPSKYDNVPLETKLLLQSRPQGYENITPQSQIRRITVANTGIQLDLCRLIWPQCVRAFRNERHRLWPYVLAYIFNTVLKGILPSAKLWANSRLLDIVERSFRGVPATWSEALAAAGLAVGLNLFQRLNSAVSSRTLSYLRQYVNYKTKKAYMKMKLGLDLQASNNPLYMAVVADASVFTGHGQSMDDTGYVISSGGGAFYLLNFASEALVQLLQLGTQVAVIMRTISLSSPDTAITLGNVVLVGLSLAPTLLTLCQERFGTWLNPYNDEPRAVRLRSLQEESKTLENIGEGSKRQELLIFGYKDWVLQRWDKLEQLSLAEEGTTTRKLEYLSMVLEVLKTTVKSGFYVLLATQAIPTTLSLGAITLHGQMAEDLLSTSRRFAELFYVTYQMPFFLAAFFVAADGPQKLGPQLDYEAYRTPGGKGMRIEARNLSFTYPGASKPALHDINLVVEPGESLAIVGFNGGGKSTLVKTILGLNTFTGELRINNLHIDDYNAETMHKRMSCLFQDYARHRLSLRVNVGFGEASQMDDDAAIEHALGCGGATMVLEQVGSLESLLSTTSVEHNEPQKKEETRPTRTRGFGMVRFRRPRLPAEGLSGGQWQRVAISRAFMRADTADLVVFDEPSASLDPRAEAELFDRIHALSMRDGKRVTTTVFISHRFSTVRRADKIAFMENGTITEYGSHEELMAKGGQYCEMFELQRSGFDG